MRAISLTMLLLLSGCTEMHHAWNGTPQERVVTEYDKFKGTSSLRAYVFESSDGARGQSLKLSREGQQPYVLVSYHRTDSTETILQELQNIRFGLAADNRPVPHSEPEVQQQLGVNWSSLTLTTAVPVDDFKALAGVNAFDIQVCSNEDSLSSYQLSIVKEFARRLNAPATNPVASE